MPNESRVSLCFIQLPVGGMAIAGVDISDLKTQQKIEMTETNLKASIVLNENSNSVLWRSAAIRRPGQTAGS
jgi:hypothetical protein